VKRTQTPAAEKAERELKEVRAYERDAHFANDVEALMRNQADDFIAIAQGKIHHLTADQMRQNFVQAFKDATYHEFDDLEEPEIFVSDDGSLAWVAARIRVRKSQIDGAGTSRERTFVSTAITTYEKWNGQWHRTSTSGSIVEGDGS
jgi:ketosteroid isomerase-like protein